MSNAQALATLLTEILDAWNLREIGVAQPDGPDAAFVEQFLIGRGMPIQSLLEQRGPQALRVADLRRLLDEVPSGWYSQPNNVGSLSLWDHHPSDTTASLKAYVDFKGGFVSRFD